ncbi:MAG: hypothetical protein M5U16_00890 [Hyphomicrobium sp.]|nr:hypothetical protein [Hyphomicrobium sp.]
MTKPRSSISSMPAMVPDRSGSSVGAHFSTTPVVGCAQATTSRLERGVGPSGNKTAPETAIGSPLRPAER